MQYGPYTPQECKKAISWLTNKNIKFEILKDQDKENEFRSNTGTNLIKQVEFRTETYLAQLFYIEISVIDEVLKQEFNLLFTNKPEIYPKSLTEKPENIELEEDIKKSVRTKRFWAWILIFIWGLSFCIYFFHH